MASAAPIDRDATISMAHASEPDIIVLMGVTSTGKTTIGRLLAERTGWRFAEGDSYHPSANVEKMRRGIPLEDADRWPWLAAITEDIRAWRERGEHAIVTCSALKRAYRDRLRRAGPLRFVHLTGDPKLLAARMAARRGHYMPPSLLPSQLATLEPPEGEPDVLTLDVTPPPAEIAARILEELGIEVQDAPAAG